MGILQNLGWGGWAGQGPPSFSQPINEYSSTNVSVAGGGAGGTGAGFGGAAGGGAGAGGAGGAGASGGAMQPNRFEAGLSDSDKRLRALLDNPDSIQQSAAYKFRVGQGQEALQRSMGAKGMLNSGNRLTDLMKYGQDMGSQEYDAQYGRLSDLYKTDSNSYNGNATVLNQTQDIANRYQMGTEANALNRDKFNYTSGRNESVSNTNGISNPWALPGYNGYKY